ncbi:MAG TPA: tetratricopeptide repeat protein [Planktothrix sp.]|jgi:tetratricopeptide (TPR) repeat protein
MRKFIAITICFFASASSTLALTATDKEFAAAMANGIDLQKHRHYHDALRCFQQARRLKPDRVDAYDCEGMALIALDDCRGAADIFTRGIKIDPKFENLYCSRSQAYFGLGDMKSALADLNHALALKPQVLPYVERRAETYESLGDHEKAIEDYTAALALCAPVNATRTTPAKPADKERFRLASERGHIYERLGKYQNAIDDYNLYLSAPERQRASSVRILHCRADCYDKLGKHDLAAKDRAAAENHKGDVLEDLMHDETLGTGR